jgi:hypothetical protein
MMLHPTPRPSVPLFRPYAVAVRTIVIRATPRFPVAMVLALRMARRDWNNWDRIGIA